VLYNTLNGEDSDDLPVKSEPIYNTGRTTGTFSGPTVNRPTDKSRADAPNR
jgi:hypothetical protein